MPAKPDSRFAGLPVLRVVAPDGSARLVLGVSFERPPDEPPAARYIVKQGEELDLLARRFLGGEQLWWRILDANSLVYPLDIKAGDVLNLPEAAPATRVARPRRF